MKEELKIFYLRSGSSENSIPVDVYVTERLARELVEGKAVYKKHIKALQHGYVGDKKGLNGVRNVHRNDGRIYKLTQTALKSRVGAKILEEHKMNRESVRAVKIVAHDPSLRRLYGFMDNGRVVLFGVDRYK